MPAVPAGKYELDAIMVTGRVQRMYRLGSTETATRTDTPSERLPLSVQTLPRQLIEDQAADDVTDLYRNISGVSAFSYGGVTMRGFRQDNVLYDGLRGDPYAGFSVPRLFSIDSLHVMKGPTGAAYGDGDPGGVINYVSKAPESRSQRALKLRLGNHQSMAGSFEASGPLRADGAIRYRIGMHADHQKPFRYNTSRRTRVDEGGLAFEVGDSGDLVLQLTRIDQALGGNRLRGVMVNDLGQFRTSPRWNANEPGDGLDHSAKAVYTRMRLSPAPGWNVNAAARWFSSTEDQHYHEPRGLAADGRSVYREFRDQHRRNRGLSADVNTRVEFTHGYMRHRALFGVEWFQQLADLQSRTASGVERKGPVPALDLFDPVYGRTDPSKYGLKHVPYSLSSNETRDLGLYVQDQIDIGHRWHILLGGRWSRYTRGNRISQTEVSGSAATWRGGVTFDWTPTLHAYLSTGTGFRPQSAASHSPLVGGPFPPQRSRSWEAGLKARPGNGRIRLDTAFYRIERSNILQSTGQDPGADGEDDLVALGLVRSQGFEADLVADVTRRWVVSASYSYNDAAIISGLPSAAGNTAGTGNRRFANAPRHKFGMWTRYDIPAWRSAIAAGVDHMGERTSLDGQHVRAYTVFDLSWQSRFGPLELQANIKNLFDKEYAASGFTRHNGHFPGEPRRIHVEARYRF